MIFRYVDNFHKIEFAQGKYTKVQYLINEKQDEKIFNSQRTKF